MLQLRNTPIHILGIGGIGAAVGWGLAHCGYSVILVDNHPGKIAEGRKKGISVVRKKQPLSALSVLPYR